MHTTYEFTAEDDVKAAQGNQPAQTSPKFTALGAVYFVTRADCEAAYLLLTSRKRRVNSGLNATIRMRP